MLQNTKTTLVGCLFSPLPATTITSHPPLPPPSRCRRSQRPPQSTMAMKQQRTRCDKNGEQDGQGNESRGRGDGLWSHPPKSYVCFFQISPILLTKGRFHHRMQQLAAPHFNTTLPMVTLPFRRGKGIWPLLRQTVDPHLVPSTQTHLFWMCFGVRRLSTCAPR